MPIRKKKEAAPKIRADAERNRTQLLDTAKRVFGKKGDAASLEEIARTAGVGIGTLYRHFPTRDALVEAVYRKETDQLGEAATRLAKTKPPLVALREWMFLFVDYVEAKHGMTDVLDAIAGGTSSLYAQSHVEIREVIDTLTKRAVTSGDIRLNMEPLDLLRALAGVSYKNPSPESRRAARQLVDILIAGLKVQP